MAFIYDRFGFQFEKKTLSTDYDKFFLIIKMPGRSTVEYPVFRTSEYPEEMYVDFINQRKIKCANVLMDDFSFLKKCPDLEMLCLYPSLQAENHVSYEPVYGMEHLRMVQPQTVYSYDKCWTEFDCAKMKSATSMEYFSGCCKKGVKNVAALTGLKSLYLSYYKAEDLTEAVGSPQMDSMFLLRSGVQSLKGLERSKSLKVLRLSTCTKLNNIDALADAGENLQGLVIESCSNIKDYSALSTLKSLRRLSILGTGSMPSVSFINELHNLQAVMLGVNVLDGDLSCCDRMLHAYIRNRRHYNRSNDQFPKLTRPFSILGDEEIEAWRRNMIS